MAANIRHLISTRVLFIMVNGLSYCRGRSWGFLRAWIIGSLLGVSIDENVVADVDFF